MDLNRIASLALAVVYVTGAYVLGSADTGGMVLGWCLLSLVLIWFGDWIFENAACFIAPRFTENMAPGCVLKFLGWMLFLAPTVILLINRSRTTSE